MKEEKCKGIQTGGETSLTWQLKVKQLQSRWFMSSPIKIHALNSIGNGAKSDCSFWFCTALSCLCSKSNKGVKKGPIKWRWNNLKMTTLTPVKKTLFPLDAVLSGKILTRNLKEQQSSSSKHRSGKLVQKQIMLAGGAKGAASFPFQKGGQTE